MKQAIVENSLSKAQLNTTSIGNGSYSMKENDYLINKKTNKSNNYNILQKIYQKGQIIFNIIKDKGVKENNQENDKSIEESKKRTIKIIYNNYKNDSLENKTHDVDKNEQILERDDNSKNHAFYDKNHYSSILNQRNEYFEEYQSENCKESYEEVKVNNNSIEINDHEILNEGNSLPPWLNNNLDF